MQAGHRTASLDNELGTEEPTSRPSVVLTATYGHWVTYRKTGSSPYLLPTATRPWEQSDSSRNEFEPRPVSSIGLSIGLGRESRSTCDSRFHLLSPNQTPPFHGLLSYKRARENSMVGTQMEASLAEGIMQERLGLHTLLSQVLELF